MTLPETLGLVQSAVFFTVLALGGIHDATRRRIPRRVALYGGALGLALATARSLFAGGGAAGTLASLGGAGTALALFLPFVWFGSLGREEAFFFGAAGALTSARFVLHAAAGTAVAGCLLALGWLALRGGWGEAFSGALRLKRPGRSALVAGADPARTIPYGLAIAAGCAWGVASFLRQGLVLPWDEFFA